MKPTLPSCPHSAYLLRAYVRYGRSLTTVALHEFLPIVIYFDGGIRSECYVMLYFSGTILARFIVQYTQAVVDIASVFFISPNRQSENIPMSLQHVRNYNNVKKSAVTAFSKLLIGL